MRSGDARRGTVWHCLARPGMARLCRERQGQAWLGMTWHSEAWRSNGAKRRKEKMFITIEIEGVTALICNRFTDEAALASTSGDRGSSAAADRGTPQEICESKLYKGSNGKPMIPAPNLLRSIVDGGAFTKIGKKQLTTARASVLYSCVAIEEIEVPIVHKQPWKVDTRPVRIPSTGGRILTHRPMFDDWKLAFEVDLDTSICNAKVFRQVVDDAGKRVGLGDFRPSTKGPYGRFTVVRWVEQQVKLSTKAA